jgi:hypothetical protein
MNEHFMTFDVIAGIKIAIKQSSVANKMSITVKLLYYTIVTHRPTCSLSGKCFSALLVPAFMQGRFSTSVVVCKKKLAIFFLLLLGSNAIMQCMREL